MDLVFECRKDIYSCVSNEDCLFESRYVHNEAMADSARSPETGVTCDHRAHQFIGVETALHQHFSFAFTYKANGRVRGSLTMGRVDELVAGNVCSALLRGSLDFCARPDQDRCNKAKISGLDCALERTLVARMCDRGRRGV